MCMYVYMCKAYYILYYAYNILYIIYNTTYYINCVYVLTGNFFFIMSFESRNQVYSKMYGSKCLILNETNC